MVRMRSVDAHRYAAFFPVRFESDGTRAVLHAPPALYVKRALLSILLAPVFGTVGWALTDNDDPALSVLGWVLVALGVFFVVWACVLLPFARVWSRRTEVTFDRVAGMVTHARPPGGAPAYVPLSAIAAVRLRKRDGLAQWWTLEALDGSGRAFPLQERLPAMSRDLVPLAHDVAAFLGVPAQVPEEVANGLAGGLAMSESTAAVLCYLPVQGIFLIASVICLVADRRPFVRFAAKQSLLHFASSLVALIVVAVLGVVPVVLTQHDDGPLRVMTIVWLAMLLVSFAVWNIGAHVYACVQAAKGRAWVMPWLRPIVKNWAP